jgi:hypothetical protein
MMARQRQQVGSGAVTPEAVLTKMLDLQARLNLLESRQILSLVMTGSQQTISSTSQSVINGLSCPVSSGITYRLSGQIIWTQGSTQAQQAMRINGPSVSNAGLIIRQDYDNGTTGNNVVTTFVSTMNADSNGYGASGIPATTASWWTFDGTVSFSASGTLTANARCVTSGADTFKIFPYYTYMDVWQVL